MLLLLLQSASARLLAFINFLYQMLEHARRCAMALSVALVCVNLLGASKCANCNHVQHTSPSSPFFLTTRNQFAAAADNDYNIARLKMKHIDTQEFMELMAVATYIYRRGSASISGS